MEISVAETVGTAYERAYEEHWHDVFRFALSWTNEWAAAEDLTQEAYVRLWRSRTRVDWQRPMLPWLLVTTRRLATDRFRALRRRVVGTSVPRSLDDSVVDRWLEVRAAMAILSPVERSALVLTVLKGFSYGEAAEMLGTSAGALRAAVSRARDKLEVSK